MTQGLDIRLFCVIHQFRAELRCHLTVPASSRVSFGANLIICQCASNKNHSHQLPLQHECTILLSKWLIGIIDQYVWDPWFYHMVCLSHWWAIRADFPLCLHSSPYLPFGKENSCLQEIIMAFFSCCFYPNCCQKLLTNVFDGCLDKSTDVVPTTALVQSFSSLCDVLVSHICTWNSKITIPQRDINVQGHTMLWSLSFPFIQCDSITV